MSFRFALLVVTIASGTTLAASGDTLPERLSGKWEASGSMDRFTYKGTEAVTFEGAREPGPVRGRVNHQGVVCGADNAPFAGTWDGKVLRFEVEYTAISAKAQSCVGQNTYVLERKGAGFEGTIRSKGGNSLIVTLAP